MAGLKTIRALHVIDTLGAAGAEHQLATLIPSLRQHDIECEVAVLQAPYTLQPLFEERGIKVNRLDLWDARNFISSSIRLGKLLRAGQYDIVHAHLWLSITAVALSKPFSGKQKRFVTFHNSEYQQFPVHGPIRWLHRVFDRGALRYGIDYSVSVTRFIARSNQELLNAPTSQVIFNGLDLTTLPVLPPEQRRQIRAKLGVRPDEFLVITAGRLGMHKGHSVLIAAVNKMALEGAPIRLLIYGNGPLRQKLQNEIASLGLESVITLSGLAHHTDLFAAVSAADVFAFPSLKEAFGLAAAEAMAVGTAVVASGVDGIPEVVENGVSGILVPANDPQVLAAALRELKDDPCKRAALALAGQKRVREKFDISKVSAELAALYRTALGLKSQAAAEVSF
jgi:glycosyltransferase involved in cell wall biosynthesis